MGACHPSGQQLELAWADQHATVVEVDYALGEAGLTVATTATNVGCCPCPYGAGQHPYLSPGPGLVDDCTLQLDGTARILTDNERQLPTGTEAVTGTPYDFREARTLGAQRLDFAFTDLARDRLGRAWAALGGPDGHTAELWVDEHYPIIELYSGDTLAPGRRRRGLGTEPMTCPPNAFQSGEGVIRLEPGQAVTFRALYRLEVDGALDCPIVGVGRLGARSRPGGR